ncbi:adhesin [Methanobrevibacter sp.]|uniref:adhesin n=1 Tax=Methanobrevibacter sp. TaxID=66852 RepID=UPI00388FCD6B
MKLKFTLIDYIIIILVICAIAFAFIHITTDDSSDLQKTAFDESTVNKIPDTYLKYYKDGYIVKSTVEGYNSSNGEKVTITGDVIWQDNSGGFDVKLLIATNNGTYLTGLYRYNPNSDIYIDHISLESNGEKYANLVEITAKPKKINTLNELISGIDNNTNFEITTRVSFDEISSNQLQEITNALMNHGKRVSVKSENRNNGQLIISQATKQNINDVSSIIGNINGITDEITIRIYDSTDSQIKAIQDNYDVINIRNF